MPSASARRFLDLGAGTGLFTTMIPGEPIAVDQSEAMLRQLRARRRGVPVVRADALALPMRSHSVDRVVAAHLYGHLRPDERMRFVDEAERVGGEIVVIDSGRPPGAPAEQWQTRRLRDGSEYTIYTRHFDADELAAELNGEAVFAGDDFVVVRVAA